jgi:signal transduction histidine kinase
LKDPLLEFERPRRDLADSVSELLARRWDEHAGAAWTEEDWVTLERLRKLLEVRVTDLPDELRYATLRQIASEVLEMLSRMESGHLAREIERRARTAASELRRLGTVLGLLLAKGKLVELGAELRTVKDSVTRRNRPIGPPKILRVADLLRTALAEQAEYAQSRQVDLQRHFETDADAARVEGQERDLVRALGNILHNAVKYSWHREGATYATVRLGIGNGKITLETTNYGVPIPEDEIGLVCKIGFRGRFSGDRRRAGTGIGLWDAQRVARSHRGDLYIASRPASGRDPNNYKQPFLTTVTMELPAVDITGG